MAKSTHNSHKSNSKNSVKPSILKTIKTEYFAAFFAMALIIIGAVAGEKLYPATRPQLGESQAGEKGSGFCDTSGCYCNIGYPDTCEVNHYYNLDNQAPEISDPLKTGEYESTFSRNCGSEQIDLATRTSNSRQWNLRTDSRIERYAEPCESVSY